MTLSNVWVRAGAAVLWAALAWGAFEWLYAGPVARAEREVGQLRQQVAAVQEATPSRGALRDRADRLGATLLSRDLADMEHQLRSTLGRIAAESGLREVVVSSGPPKGVASPVLGAGVRDAGLVKALRERADFELVRGRLTGVGSFAAVTACVASLQSQAWVHRVEGVALTPTDETRREFSLRVDFASMRAPAWVPAAEREGMMPDVAAVPDATRVLAEGLVARAPFAPPAALVEVVAATAEGGDGAEATEAAPARIAPRLVAVVQTGDGANGQAESWWMVGAEGVRVARVGESVGGVVLMGVEGERAIVSVDEGARVVAVGVGSTSDQGVPVERAASVTNSDAGGGS